MFILSVLLTLIGCRPLTLLRTKNGEFRSKLDPLGILLVIFHLSLCIYGDFLSHTTFEENPTAYKDKNNIMRAIVLMGRVVQLILGPTLALTSFLQTKAHRHFLVSEEDFDEYLVGYSVQVQSIKRKLRLLDISAAVGLFLVTIGNLTLMSFLFTKYYQQPVPIYELYNTFMSESALILNVILTCLVLHGTTMRMEFYCKILRQIRNQSWREQRKLPNLL